MLTSCCSSVTPGPCTGIGPTPRVKVVTGIATVRTITHIATMAYRIRAVFMECRRSVATVRTVNIATGRLDQTRIAPPTMVGFATTILRSLWRRRRRGYGTSSERLITTTTTVCANTLFLSTSDPYPLPPWSLFVLLSMACRVGYTGEQPAKGAFTVMSQQL